MTTLSREKVMELLVGAGFKKNGTDTATMVGICYAESGGDPSKHNANAKTGDDSYGLWQINMLGKLGAPRRKAFGISSNSELFDPATNARAARIIYNQSGLNAWSTYKRGEYLKFMDDTTGYEDGKPTEADNGGIENPLSDVPTSIKDAVNSLGANLLKGTANISGIAIGIVLLVLGVVLLMRKPLGNLLPAGKAVKALKAVS